MEAEVGLGERVQEEYVVRLLFKFDASGPVEAVEKMISELADNGLRTWHYRVERPSTGELFFVTGHGDLKTIDEMIADQEDEEVEDVWHDEDPSVPVERTADPVVSADLDALIRLGRT